ncbi:MAG: hypothetical protein AUJ96_01200 [Armatimonadetes bacterium CG2_30_66_41]|nr:MAG: hypothetical protein AUJ96_01200 [Armatimonadetes bacterium CG2_30_66_41]
MEHLAELPAAHHFLERPPLPSWRQLWNTDSDLPARSVASIIWVALAIERHIGFSTHVCLPAFRH